MATRKKNGTQSKQDGTQIRMKAETHARFRALADRVGVPQTLLLRTLSYATPEDYVKCEQRRLIEGEGKPADDES